MSQIASTITILPTWVVMLPLFPAAINTIMMIEFQCGNLITEKGKESVVCGNRIIVSEELIGDLVTCSKCRQTVEVPVASNPNRPPRPNPNAPKSRLNAAPRRRRAPPSKSSVGKSSSPSSSKSSYKNLNQQESLTKNSPHSLLNDIDDEYRLSDPLDLANTDLSFYNLDDEATGTVPVSTNRLSGNHNTSHLNSHSTEIDPNRSHKPQRQLCERCGAMLDQSGRCMSCGHRASAESAEKLASVDDVKMGLAGFQLWFVSTIGEAVPFSLLEWGLHISVVIIAVGLSIPALFFGGLFPGGLLVLLIACVAGLYFAMAINGHRLVTDPHARLKWFQRPFWSGMLWMARRMNWQNYDHSLRGRTIVDHRNESISDNKILKLDDLQRCEVLDLEGTEITDLGLRHIRGLRHLRCLVLRNTQVTEEGVLRLQQARRQLWIWY